MKQELTHKEIKLTSSAGSNTVGSVFCMTVDGSHSHENSGESSVCTLSTFIDEIALSHKLKPSKKIHKTKKNVAYWSPKDISALVRLLKVYGSDFQTIAVELGKTRDQVKRKFKVLEKKNPKLAEAIFEREVAP
jgi:hypothetical protein